MLPQVWKIYMFGQLTARMGGQEITRFRTHQTAALLAFLAYHPRQSHSREELIDRFWPDSTLEAGRGSLSVALTSLRRQLEPPGIAAGTVIASDRTHVRLHPIAIRTDVADFEVARQKGDSESLRAALETYQGDLLPGFYDEWILTEREQLSEAHRQMHLQLSQASEVAGDRSQALSYIRRAAALDPDCENTRRQLKRLLNEESRRIPASVNCVSMNGASVAVDVGSNRSQQEGQANKAETLGPEGTTSYASNCPPHSLGRNVPPLVSPPRPVCALPPSFTRFFGREQEVSDLCLRLTNSPQALVTVTGPGGQGKTRLAIETARCLYEKIGLRTVFVPLEEARDPSRLLPAIQFALGLVPKSSVPVNQQIIEAVAKEPCLLLLDNFDYLAVEGSIILQYLRERLPRLMCLVTSRLLLSLPGEQNFPLLPLPTPTTAASAASLLANPSAQLFVHRSQARCPDFQITPRNCTDVATLCQKLEGIPLALELAASWARTLTSVQMLARLTTRLDFLTTHRRDVPPRHRSLRAVLEESFRQLPLRDQRLFARLSVFRGGWTLEAAQVVCEEPQAANILEQLQDSSLVTSDSGETGEAGRRFRILETLREFAAEQVGADEFEDLAEGHFLYYQSLAAQGAVSSGQNWSAWLDRMQADLENVRAALQHRRVVTGKAESGLRLAEACWKFWAVRGHLAEGRTWLMAFLALTPQASPVRTLALLGSGCMAWLQTDYPDAERRLKECLVAAEAEDNARVMALTFLNLGNVASGQEHRDEAYGFYQQSLALSRLLEDAPRIASALNNLADLAYLSGDLQGARTLLEEGLTLALPESDFYGHAITMSTLAGIAGELRQFADMQDALRQYWAFARATGDARLRVFFLEHGATLAAGQGQPDNAVRLWGAAECVRETIGTPMSPAYRSKQVQSQDSVRRLIRADRFQQLWESGRLWDQEEAVNFVEMMTASGS